MVGWIDGWKKRAIAGRLFCALEMLKSELTFLYTNRLIESPKINQSDEMIHLD